MIPVMIYMLCKNSIPAVVRSSGTTLPASQTVFGQWSGDCVASNQLSFKRMTLQTSAIQFLNIQAKVVLAQYNLIMVGLRCYNCEIRSKLLCGRQRNCPKAQLSRFTLSMPTFTVDKKLFGEFGIPKIHVPTHSLALLCGVQHSSSYDVQILIHEDPYKRVVSKLQCVSYFNGVILLALRSQANLR